MTEFKSPPLYLAELYARGTIFPPKLVSRPPIILLETVATGGVSPMESEIQSLGILKKFFTELSSGGAPAEDFRGEMEEWG